MLTDLLGMSLTGEQVDRARFEMAAGDSGALVDARPESRSTACRPQGPCITWRSARLTSPP